MSGPVELGELQANDGVLVAVEGLGELNDKTVVQPNARTDGPSGLGVAVNRPLRWPPGLAGLEKVGAGAFQAQLSRG